MGCQIDCGNHEIAFSDGAWFVMGRAERHFTPNERLKAWGKPCPLGDEYYSCIPKRALKEMFDALPKDFEQAVSGEELAQMRRPINARDFDEICRFLKAAIDQDEDVSCSY